ncbi:MAG TPA: ferritin-like domain-containing protein [Microlunatus sp.]
MIDTREELIGALHQAAEIEHGLMIQYLFPALSMRKRADEGLTSSQLSMARGWEATILGVAVEEMGHLGTVCNLLSAIGDGPRFERPNFPQAVGYYPFPFDLVPFSDDALYRMLIFELPRDEPPPPPPVEFADARYAFSAEVDIGPDPLTYDYVGELYGKIKSGFAAVPESDLFIGNPSAQVSDTWSVRLDLRPVTTSAAAFAAIDDIIEDGEGAPQDRATSHYGRFLSIRTAYAAAGYFPAARPVVRNPRTRAHHPDADGPGTLITHPLACEVAELFNEVYATALLVLQQFFAYGGETPAQRAALKAAAGHLMSTGIRPIAEILTDLPVTTDADDGRAGPPFELYNAVTLSPFAPARWAVLLERLEVCATAATSLGPDLSRLAQVGETLSFVRRNLAEVAE